MKKLMLIATGALLALNLGAAGLSWVTDAAKAQQKAKAEDKLVFLNFTGSDWCGWCKKMDADVFSKAEFIDYANKNLVMVFVDFPSKKPISAEQKQANAALKKKYGVSGYPTLIVLNSKGEKVHEQVGYMGDVGKWLSIFKQAKAK